MQKAIIFLIISLLTVNHAFSQSTNSSDVGEGMNRTGFVHRYKDWIYPNNILSEWKKTRGNINPQSISGLLTNPYRQDGTSLSYGISIPSNFTGKIPIFTEGNWWPTIGNSQTPPLTYSDLSTDTGIAYSNGNIVNTTTVTRRGIDRVKIVNKTPYSYLVSSGTFPGNEQPGQVMTVIPPNGDNQLPIPPKDWWEFSFNGGQVISAVPEVYSSVAGLNPLDAPGWKHSSWSPMYKGGIQAKDYGTAGFAYTFGSLFGRNDGVYDLTNVLFAGFHTNEGYDPLVSGDPGYGCAFYINGKVQAVMDISLTSKYTAKAVIVANKRHNPESKNSPFDNTFLQLVSTIGVMPNETAELHYITHAEAARIINTYSSNNEWKKIEKQYQSNTQATIENVPLPAIIPSQDILQSSCTDGIQNGNETGIDCGGECNDCNAELGLVMGKFVPNTGTLLAVGQDASSIDLFSSSMNTVPAAVSGYTSLRNLEGIDTEASYGTGPQNLSRLATDYPNSALVVAVYLVDQLNEINSGLLDTNIDLLIDKLVDLDRPIYLRWGYEFDGVHNHYDPNQFILAWRKMYNRIKQKRAENNIAMVWHSGAFCGGQTYLNYPITSWYPGKTYVDLMGISVFTPQDCNYQAQDIVVNFARTEMKPVIIAEATPQGYNVRDKTIAPVLGNSRGIKTPKTSQQIWDEWYKPFFNYIKSNRDVIRLVTYINAEWDSQGFWDAPYEKGYWGDSRIQSNSLIRSNWNTQINTSEWIKGSENLFERIGFIQNSVTTPTCFDNIKNGDETGIDCGGTSCIPCANENTVNVCSDFGISYINNTTVRVFHKDLGFQSSIYICVNNNCYAPRLENGYYYYDFSQSITSNAVTMELGQNYTIKFLADFANVAEKVVTFNTRSCDFIVARRVSNIKKVVISPNPSSQFIELKGENISDKTQYRIFNKFGKEMMNGRGKTVDIQQLPNGLYWLKTDKNESQSFIKE